MTANRHPSPLSSTFTVPLSNNRRNFSTTTTTTTRATTQTTTTATTNTSTGNEQVTQVNNANSTDRTHEKQKKRHFLLRALSYLLFTLLTLVSVMLVVCFWGVHLYRSLDGTSGTISAQYPELSQVIDVLEGIGRFYLCIATVCIIGFQYFLVWSPYSPSNLYYRLFQPEMVTEESMVQVRKDAVHQYGADKLLNLFRKQKGLYIKIGQQVAAMAGFIPDQYVETLKVMRDQAPTISFDEVQRVIREDLGQTIDELFESFEETPIASASLAQVHRATLKDGTLVAVKVQYPYVRTFFDSDLNARDVSSRLATRMYHLQEDPDGIDELIELNDSFAQEMKFALKDELNFLKEANNAIRARHNFANRDDVYVPKVMSALTSERVLTMEFIDNACNSTDREAIQQMGFSIPDVGYKIIDAFAEQTFVHGLLHGDPHPANVLVRRHPSNSKKPQIVILDHGLYRELSDDFRQKYAKFWQSIVLKDDKGIKEYCDGLGIRDHKMYCTMVMMQGYDDFIPASSVNMEPMPKTQSGSSSSGGGGRDLLQERKMSMDDLAKIEEIMKEKKEDFMNLYRNLPMEMMIIMRSDNLLRSLNQELGNGTSVVNRFAVMARAAARGVYWKNEEGNNGNSSRSWRDKFSQWRGQITFELRLTMIRLQSWFASLYIKLFGMPKMDNLLANLQVRQELEMVESAKRKK